METDRERLIFLLSAIKQYFDGNTFCIDLEEAIEKVELEINIKAENPKKKIVQKTLIGGILE